MARITDSITVPPIIVFSFAFGRELGAGVRGGKAAACGQGAVLCKVKGVVLLCAAARWQLLFGKRRAGAKTARMCNMRCGKDKRI